MFQMEIIAVALCDMGRVREHQAVRIQGVIWDPVISFKLPWC